MIINPKIWWPLGENFDGDSIYVFYPQYLGSQAKISQLISVDQKNFSSHFVEARIALSVDT